jgi:hypothetical protein
MFLMYVFPVLLLEYLEVKNSSVSVIINLLKSFILRPIVL